MEYGIQLYSIRDLTESSLEEGVARVARLGFSSVEFAGFFGRSPEQVCEMLKNNDIKISGTHSSFDDLVNDYEGTVAFHKAIGNKYYIVPGYDLNSQEKLDAFVEKVALISPKLKEDGITLGYHNHAHEFVPNADGSVVFEQLLYRTDIKLELDTYWAFVGMKDPVTLMERIKDRLIFIHIKDGDDKGNGKPLGMGEAPLADIYNKAVELGIPMVVESETCTPSGIAEAEICIDYLKTLE